MQVFWEHKWFDLAKSTNQRPGFLLTYVYPWHFPKRLAHDSALNVLYSSITNIWFWNYNPRRIHRNFQIPYSRILQTIYSVYICDAEFTLLRKLLFEKCCFEGQSGKSRTRPEIRNSIDVFTKSNFMFLTTFNKR